MRQGDYFVETRGGHKSTVNWRGAGVASEAAVRMSQPLRKVQASHYGRCITTEGARQSLHQQDGRSRDSGLVGANSQSEDGEWPVDTLVQTRRRPALASRDGFDGVAPCNSTSSAMAKLASRSGGLCGQRIAAAFHHLHWQPAFAVLERSFKAASLGNVSHVRVAGCCHRMHPHPAPPMPPRSNAPACRNRAIAAQVSIQPFVRHDLPWVGFPATRKLTTTPCATSCGGPLHLQQMAR
ncbi:hypothetical protein PMIN01_12605 [Paraphaeosphaeria minitans]|uniref:Uncharacterized protein n=1 Tax=Paraphaeosphaeria minitans TaxID=565426 RepID=A0A9P6G603_9PLEO|nr:hypothetical protein PMIN01_12605 [Paraphaeosphaeria minitans]